MRETFVAILAVLSLSTSLHARTFYIAFNGNDANPGTDDAPFRTIQHAANLAQPGDTITVHEGIYRERIDPPRGGTSDTNRIVYQAAPGEKPVITGSEPVKNWVKVQDDVWKVVIPNTFFGGFNPYSDLIHGDWFNPLGRQHHTGAVYLHGYWLAEAATLDDVMKPMGEVGLWFAQVDSSNTTIWAQFNTLDPNQAPVEINVRQTVFYPSKPASTTSPSAASRLRMRPPTGRPNRRANRRHWPALEQRLDHRAQSGPQFRLLRNLAGKIRRPVRQHLGQFRRRLRQDHRARPGQWLDEGKHRPPHRSQQHNYRLRTSGHRRQPRRGIQHHLRQHYPRYPRPRARLPARKWPASSSMAQSMCKSPQPHLSHLPWTVARLDGAGDACLRQPLLSK